MTIATRESIVRRSIDNLGYKLFKTPARSSSRIEFGAGFEIRNLSGGVVHRKDPKRAFSSTLEEIEAWYAKKTGAAAKAPVMSRDPYAALRNTKKYGRDEFEKAIDVTQYTLHPWARVDSGTETTWVFHHEEAAELVSDLNKIIGISKNFIGFIEKNTAFNPEQDREDRDAAIKWRLNNLGIREEDPQDAILALLNKLQLVKAAPAASPAKSDGVHF
jgi:hypothetical protein